MPAGGGISTQIYRGILLPSQLNLWIYNFREIPIGREYTQEVKNAQESKKQVCLKFSFYHFIMVLQLILK